LAEPARVSVDAALAAYVVGVETTLCVGRAVNPRHYDAGWHATASLGVFGATMASALLRGLDDERIAHALGIAASMSSGIKCNFGSDVKPLQVGLAAGNGVLAAQLAKNGVRASDGALFGPTGFVGVYGGAGDAGAAVAAFGAPFGFERPGFNIKVYPCCSSAHTAVDGMLEILNDDGVKAADIAAIEVAIGPDVPAMLKYDLPRLPLEGKFSMRYCVGAAALRGALDLDSFTHEALVDSALVAMLERVRVVVDPTLPRIPTGVTHCSRVRVTLKDGSTRLRQIEDPLGSAARPIALDRLRHKFVRCVTPSLGSERASEAFDSWLAADGETPLAAWITRLCKDASR
jgi:2-methylcitrate dehydratase PrpD